MAAAAVFSESMGGQVLLVGSNERPKRRRVKSVTWPTDDKLCQVRMFMSEDAPSTSGPLVQDLLQSKESRFFPVPILTSRKVQDLPPGFGGAVMKRMRLDETLKPSMTSDITWRHPEKFVINQAWLVAEGGESTEVASQRLREVSMLEAVYPRLISIPPSPGEPQEKCNGIDDSFILQIPLLPVEEDDEDLEENSLAGVSLSGVHGAVCPESCRPEPGAIMVCQQSDANVVHEILKADVLYDKGAERLSNADPDIAAAAAAAYAAVKELEGSSLIDHELLFEILSNPAMMQSLIVSSQKFKETIGASLINSSSRSIAIGNKISTGECGNQGPCIPSCPPSVTQHAPKPSTSLTEDVLQQISGTSKVHTLNQAAIAGLDSVDRPSSIINAQDQSLARMGPRSHASGVPIKNTTMRIQDSDQPLKDSNMNLQAPAALVQYQDYFPGLVQKHCVAGRSNESQIVQLMKVANSLPNEEWGFQTQNLPRGSIGVGCQAENLPRALGLDPGRPLQNLPRENAITSSCFDMPRLKSRKLCLYFNTAKGCRNGERCCFSHESNHLEAHYSKNRYNSVTALKEVLCERQF